MWKSSHRFLEMAFSSLESSLLSPFVAKWPCPLIKSRGGLKLAGWGWDKSQGNQGWWASRTDSWDSPVWIMSSLWNHASSGVWAQRQWAPWFAHLPTGDGGPWTTWTPGASPGDPGTALAHPPSGPRGPGSLHLCLLIQLESAPAPFTKSWQTPLILLFYALLQHILRGMFLIFTVGTALGSRLAPCSDLSKSHFLSWRMEIASTSWSAWRTDVRSKSRALARCQGFLVFHTAARHAAHNVPPVHKGCFKGNALKIAPGARRVPFLDVGEKTPTLPLWKMTPGAWRE